MAVPPVALWPSPPELALAFALAVPSMPSSQLRIVEALVIDVVAIAVPPFAIQPSALAEACAKPSMPSPFVLEKGVGRAVGDHHARDCRAAGAAARVGGRMAVLAKGVRVCIRIAGDAVTNAIDRRGVSDDRVGARRAAIGYKAPRTGPCARTAVDAFAVAGEGARIGNQHARERGAAGGGAGTEIGAGGIGMAGVGAGFAGENRSRRRRHRYMSSSEPAQ